MKVEFHGLILALFCRRIIDNDSYYLIWRYFKVEKRETTSQGFFIVR